MVLAAGQLACRLAVLLVQEVLTQHAQQPTAWPTCPRCGARLRSKGFLPIRVKLTIVPLHVSVDR
jgi:tRNA(Ile2) C34 agmatinyltransferase TiaS